MNKLVIVGAGGFGKEVAWLARRCGKEVVGFLDDTPEKQNLILNEVPVLGPITLYEQYLECDFILAIGNPRAKEKIVRDKLQKVRKFATLIDPSALVGENILLGEGVIICANSILTVNIKIGNHSVINLNTSIGHDVVVGAYATIAPNVALSGNLQIGNCVEIGTNAALRERLHIGDGAMIGMGAVVTKDVYSNHVVVGNPARLLKILENA
jgi:sugar O-acyltransferase (sialic acid O-acetyltransferase NeuD family)